MIVRNATIMDLEKIVEFNLKLAMETESKELNSDLVTKGVSKVLKGEVDGEYFVCEVNGEIAGQMMILYEWSDWRNGEFIWIQSVYIQHKYRKIGVFKKLYNHVKSYCESDENFVGLRLYVDRENLKAKNAYNMVGMNESNYDLFEYYK